ncbi:MAG TPA: hypothetical protein VEB21_16980, partial [Terriglobales bacterium]|nr:hypothetical protein [Terriglobales bacterium]
EHLERALQRLPPLRRQLPHTGIDLEIEIRLTLGWALWLLGYPDQAIASAQQAAQTATERQDPNSCTVALVYLFNVHHLRGEYDLAAARARELQAVGDEYDLYLPKRTGLIMEAAALMEQGELDRAVWRLLESEATEGAAGLQQVVRTYYLGRVAANCVCVGTPEQGLALAGEALERIQATGFATSKAEIRRIQGELLQLLEPEAMARYAGEWGSEPEAAAEWCFQQALEIARSQGARAWELRAAVSRARLWNRQGRRGEAQQQLADIYSQYSEGVATADLREAAAVLEHR